MVARFVSPFISLRRQIRERGLVGGVALAFDHLRNQLTDRREILYFANLPSYRSPFAPDPERSCEPATSLDDLSPADIEALREYAGSAYLSAMRERFAQGWIFYVGRIRGEFAGGGWVLTARHKAKVVPLLDGDASIVDCFTLPSLRGRNVYPHLLASVASAFRERGGLRVFIGVNPWNVASIKGLEKAAFSPAIEYRTRRFGRREFVTWLLP